MRTIATLTATLSLTTTPLLGQAAPAPDNAVEAAAHAHSVRISDDVTLHVRDTGEGDPVLVLAGGPGFAGEQMLPVAQTIAKTHRAILPDQRGTGASTADLDPQTVDAAEWTFDRAVADLEAIREHLGIESWRVTGHSWGGLLAMAYAGQHPDRVDSLLLIAPAGHTSEFWATYSANLQERMTDEDRAAIENADMGDMSVGAMASYRRETNIAAAPAMLATDATKKQLATLRAQMGEEMFNPLVGMVMTGALMRYDLSAQLATYESAVTIVQGDQDAIGRDTVDKIEAAFPNATLEIIEGCGHFPFIEKPETLDTAIAAWLRKTATD